MPARDKDYDRRKAVMLQWLDEGVASVVQDNTPAFISIRIEDEVFTDTRAHFPSECMVAQCGLALAAGLNDLKRLDGPSAGEAIAGNKARRLLMEGTAQWL